MSPVMEGRPARYALLVAVFFDVSPSRMLGMFVRMMGVARRRVRMVSGGFVVAGLVMLRRFRVVVSRGVMVLRSLLVVFSSLVRHGDLPFEGHGSGGVAAVLPGL